MKKIFLILLVGLSIYSCSSDNSIVPNVETETVVQKIPKTRGAGCPYHLTEPCPPTCFSNNHPHCLNPGHANIHTTTNFIAYDDCIFNLPGTGGGTGDNTAICDECLKCLACIDILNGLPYARYLHTCSESCGDPCCSGKK